MRYLKFRHGYNIRECIKKEIQMKKVSIIGTVGIPSRYGGFETLAHHLTNQLKDDFKFTVYCSKKAYPKKDRVEAFNGANLVYLPYKANGIQSVIYDVVSIFHAIIYSDTLLVLGVSGAIIFPFVKMISNKKIIVNIDGLEWKRNKWSKYGKIFLKWSEKLAVHFADATVTDNQAIKDYAFKEYGVVTDLVEYGGDHVVKSGKSKFDLKQFPFLNSAYAFKVARIEPENNVHVILEGFSKSLKKLVVVGNWENSAYGIQLKSFYSKFENIHLLDPIYDQNKLDLIREGCALYVHGHSAGGTNPSLVEAMSLDLPVLAYDVNYNRCTTENQAFYFTDIEDLKRSLRKFSDVNLEQNGKRMGDIAKRRYTWPVIAKKYESVVYRVNKVLKSTEIEKPQLVENQMFNSGGNIPDFQLVNNLNKH